MDSTVLILVIGAITAGFVQGLTGFGFGMVATSIWVWWLPPQLMAVMGVFGALTGQLIAFATQRRSPQWRLLLPMLAGGIAGLPLGLWLLPRLDSTTFQFGLGLLLAVWCPLMLFAHRMPHVKAGGRGADALAGLAGGVCGPLGGFTGVLPTLWTTLRGWPKDSARAVIQNFNLTMLAITFAGQVATGVVTPALLPYFAWVAPVLLVPVLLGARLYAGISPDAFRRIVLALLSGAGVALLAKSVPVLLSRMA